MRTPLDFALLRITHLKSLMQLASRDKNPHHAFLQKSMLRQLLSNLFTSQSQEFQNKFVAHFIDQDHELLDIHKVLSSELQPDVKKQIAASLQRKLEQNEISLQDAREILFQVFAVPEEASSVFTQLLPKPPLVHAFDPTRHIISYVASLTSDSRGLGNQHCAEIIAHSGATTRPVVIHILLDLARTKIAQIGADTSLIDLEKTHMREVLQTLLVEFFSRFITDSQMSQLSQPTRLSPALIGVAEIDTYSIENHKVYAQALDALAAVLQETLTAFPELSEWLRAKILNGEAVKIDRATAPLQDRSDTVVRFSVTPLLRILTAAIISTDSKQFPHLDALRTTAQEIIGVHPAVVYESLVSYNFMLYDLFKFSKNRTPEQSKKIAQTTKLLISLFARSLISANLTHGSFRLLDGRVDSTLPASALLPSPESNNIISSLLNQSGIPIDSSHMQSWEQLAKLAE